MLALTCAHKHKLTQSHSCKYTHKHTRYPIHKHTSSVSRTFGFAVCKLPFFQGKAWPFTSLLVFACTNCWVVQSIPEPWCLKAHFVGWCVQVSLPKLLTKLVRKGRVACWIREKFYLTDINFPLKFWCCVAIVDVVCVKEWQQGSNRVDSVLLWLMV